MFWEDALKSAQLVNTTRDCQRHKVEGDEKEEEREGEGGEAADKKEDKEEDKGEDKQEKEKIWRLLEIMDPLEVYKCF